MSVVVPKKTNPGTNIETKVEALLLVLLLLQTRKLQKIHMEGHAPVIILSLKKMALYNSSHKRNILDVKRDGLWWD